LFSNYVFSLDFDINFSSVDMDILFFEQVTSIVIMVDAFHCDGVVTFKMIVGTVLMRIQTHVVL